VVKALEEPETGTPATVERDRRRKLENRLIVICLDLSAH
jgi:hypothetical protein